MKMISRVAILFLLLLLVSIPATTASVVLFQSGRNVTLAWDDPYNNPTLTRYWVYHTMSSGVYTTTDRRDAGAATTFTWTDMPYGVNFFTVTAYSPSAGIESTRSNEVNVTVSPPVLTLACPSVTMGVVGTVTNTTFIAGGGVSPYSFSITSGALPPGLILSGATGVIAGTPTAPGVFSFTGQVSDQGGSIPATCSCTITIAPAAPSGLEITSGPTATLIDRKTIMIRWETSTPADSLVSYWKRNAASLSEYDATQVSSHEVLLTELQPNQSWSYSVRSVVNGQTVTGSGSFRTR